MQKVLIHSTEFAMVISLCFIPVLFISRGVQTLHIHTLSSGSEGAVKSRQKARVHLGYINGFRVYVYISCSRLHERERWLNDITNWPTLAPPTLQWLHATNAAAYWSSSSVVVGQRLRDTPSVVLLLWTGGDASRAPEARASTWCEEVLPLSLLSRITFASYSSTILLPHSPVSIFLLP